MSAPIEDERYLDRHGNHEQRDDGCDVERRAQFGRDERLDLPDVACLRRVRINGLDNVDLLAKQSATIPYDVGEGHKKNAGKAQELSQPLEEPRIIDEGGSKPDRVVPDPSSSKHQRKTEFPVQPRGCVDHAGLKRQRDDVVAFWAFNLPVLLRHAQLLPAPVTRNDGSGHAPASTPQVYHHRGTDCRRT